MMVYARWRLTARRLGFAWIVAAFGAAQAHESDTLDRVVVSATALGLTDAALNQHVQIFTRADIDAMPASSVAEFLVRAAGMAPDRLGRNGGYGSFFLRGADPSHVVVLIDGVRQNDPLSSRGSAVDMNALTLDDVERIEVIRGNTSVVNGEALAGVIQLFTRALSSDAKRAMAEEGGHQLRAVSVGVQTSGWRLSGSRRRDGDGADTELRNSAANLGWGLRSQRTSVRADLRASESHSLAFPDDSGGARYAVRRLLEITETRSAHGAVHVQHEFASGDVLDLRISHLERSMAQSSPGVAPGVRDPGGLPALRSDADFRRTDMHVGWLLGGDSWKSTVAVQHQQESGSLGSLLFIGFPLAATFTRDRHTTALIGEVRKTWDAVSVNAGLRSESSGSEGHANHPSLSLQYRLPDAAGSIGAALSSAAKLPSFYALGHPLVGNPALRIESTRQVEAYYATQLAGVSPLRITWFKARYRDLVDFAPGPPPQLVNRARIESDGIEFDLRHSLQAGLATRLQGTLMNVRDPDGKEPLRHRPHAQLSGGLNGKFGDTSWATDVLYLGRRWDSSIPTGGRWLSALTRVNASLGHRFKQATVFVALDNVLGSQAEETIGTEAGARRARIGVRFEL